MRLATRIVMMAAAFGAFVLLAGCTPTVGQEAGQVREYSQRTHEKAPGDGRPLEADPLPVSEFDPDEPERRPSSTGGTNPAGQPGIGEPARDESDRGDPGVPDADGDGVPDSDTNGSQ